MSTSIFSSPSVGATVSVLLDPGFEERKSIGSHGARMTGKPGKKLTMS